MPETGDEFEATEIVFHTPAEHFMQKKVYDMEV